MKTSYYGRIGSKKYAEYKDKGVCISRSHKYWNGRCYPALYPTWEMINMTDEDEYEEAYYDKVLSKLDPLEVYNDLGEDAVLLCFESIAKIEAGETFCHRHMVARWLECELLKQYNTEVEIKELDESDLHNFKLGNKELKKQKSFKQMALFSKEDIL